MPDCETRESVANILTCPTATVVLYSDWCGSVGCQSGAANLSAVYSPEQWIHHQFHSYAREVLVCGRKALLHMSVRNCVDVSVDRFVVQNNIVSWCRIDGRSPHRRAQVSSRTSTVNLVSVPTPILHCLIAVGMTNGSVEFDFGPSDRWTQDKR